MNTTTRTPITISTATHEDLDDICLLADEIALSHSEQAPQIFAPPPGIERDRALWENLLNQNNGLVLMARKGNQAAGFISARIVPPGTLSYLVPRTVCVINTIVVAREQHRSGIGRQLLAAIEQWAAASGAVEIRLEVFDFNRGAIKLYETTGFKVQSRIMTKPIVRD